MVATSAVSIWRTRAFKRLNREVKILLAMDRHPEPHRCDEWAENIVSGGDRRSLMNSILEEVHSGIRSSQPLFQRIPPLGSERYP